MNRGCVIFAFLLVVGIGIAGFFAYRALRDSLELPPELAGFSNQDSLLANLKHRDPAPSDSADLTANDVKLYIGALTPINAGWKPLEAVFDSMGVSKGGKGINVFASPRLLGEIMLVGPRVRKELAIYLNANGISWERYIWMKEHVVAASGITEEQLETAVEAKMADYIDSKHTRDSTGNKPSDKDFDGFFGRVDSLRRAGLIDSAETALVLPHRATLLEEGLPSLIGVETNTSFNLNLD